MNALTPIELPPIELPTSQAHLWLAQRTEAALAHARDRVEALKRGARDSQEVLSFWNDLEIGVGNAAAIAGVFSELHTDPRARQQGEDTLQLIDRFTTEISLDAALFRIFQDLPPEGLDPESARLVQEILRDFRRSGVDKDEATRARITEISERMVILGQDFSRNIRTDVRSLALPVERLGGMPQDWIAARVDDGGMVRVTTDYPDAIPLFTFAEDRRTRWELRTEFLNRAWPENDPVLQELFALRREYAALVGYETWADYDAEVKMVGRGGAIIEFIDSVTSAARGRAEEDYAILLERLRKDDPDAEEVSLADKDFYVEQVRKERYRVDSAEVREYFHVDRVVEGVLRLTRELFDIVFTPTEAPVWDEDVRVYDVTLGTNVALGRAYLDLHPREGKFGHAAQFTLVDGVAGVQLPEGVLGCNFGRGLIDHDDVVTLFHEFGHLLHHLLAGRGRYMRFAGVATEWDFVEAPSQMFEEWAWDPDVLATFAINGAGEPIPAEIVERMRAAKDFGKGFDALTQMFYAAMSYEFHVEEIPDLTQRLIELQGEYSMFAYIPGTHMMANFGHLDGYTCGYYTYMWSLVIAKDMFTRFSSDLFDTRAARAYRDEVLAAGGTRDAAELVEGFLGRPYSLEAFHAWLAE